MTKRIGFACKWIDRPDQVDGLKPNDDARQYNTGGTTVAWLKRQSREVAEQKLHDVVVSNIEATRKLVERVGELDEQLRMVRFSSDILPMYTEPTFGSFYHDVSVKSICENGFGKIGALARTRGVRLSFHPGQFTVLASESDAIVGRSIEEFEYHADMARWMGYGREFQDFKINVHISGKRGPMGIRSAWQRLSPEARNCLTIENEEMTHGINDCLELADLCPIVLDIHHHWVREGEYILPDSETSRRVFDSWRGIRPTIHYSVSRDDVLAGHANDQLPNRSALFESGLNKSKLRAHSDFYWNRAVNQWALSFLDHADIMCESKAKNLASHALYELSKTL